MAEDENSRRVRESLERVKRLKEIRLARQAATAAAATPDGVGGGGDGAGGGAQQELGGVKPPGGEPIKPVKGLGRAELIAQLKLRKQEERSLIKNSDTSGGTDGAEPKSAAARRAELLQNLQAARKIAGKEPKDPTSGDPETGYGSGKNSGGTEDLAVDLEQLKLAPTFPAKKRGEKGTKFHASANIIRMKIKENMGVFEYHCKFDPPVDNIKDKKRIIKQFEDVLGTTRSFDGATLCLPKVLDRIVTVCHGTTQSGDPVTVSIKVVKRKELKDCEQLFNVLFRKILEILKMVEIKRNHYDPTARMMVPQHKLEIWPGYVVRVAEMDGGLMLTCDTAFKVLRNETAYSMIQDVRKKGGNLRDNLEKALIGQVIMTEYNHAATYRIDDIDFEQTPRSTFTTYTGQEMSYQAYYKKMYNLDIEDLDQPMLIYRERKKRAGELDVERNMVFVPELCRMTGLTDTMVADFRVMKDVALFTKVSPDQRQLALKKFLANVHNSPESVKILADWGLELDTDVIRLTGRTMEPEKLLMGKGIQCTVNSKADWGRDATNNNCLVPVPVNKWHVMCWERNKPVAEGFIKLMKELGPKMGIKVSHPTLSLLPNDRTETYLKDAKENINSSQQLIVCIVPQQREDRYGAIKKLCNSDCPIPSQVVVTKTISNEKKVNSVVQKILLQINCKLGGELWGCKIPLKHIMCVGIDVYHDPTRMRPSVLGAVANMNSTMSKWANSCKFQRAGQELIDVLTICLGELIFKYRQDNGCLPDQVVLFRDGVGDGQIDIVANHEARQCEDFFSTVGFQPEFAFVIVQKRINRRIFKMEGSKYANPPPGSVVDHTVMKKSYYDFLLVSQHVSQGTVTPTHYIVIRDTTEFSPDIMQKISYKLTHMYFNWPGTVRVPAPCQYAHKLAYQVGEHTKVEPSLALADRLFFL